MRALLAGLVLYTRAEEFVTRGGSRQAGLEKESEKEAQEKLDAERFAALEAAFPQDSVERLYLQELGRSAGLPHLANHPPLALHYKPRRPSRLSHVPLAGMGAPDPLGGMRRGSVGSRQCRAAEDPAAAAQWSRAAAWGTTQSLTEESLPDGSTRHTVVESHWAKEGASDNVMSPPELSAPLCSERGASEPPLAPAQGGPSPARPVRLPK